MSQLLENLEETWFRPNPRLFVVVEPRIMSAEQRARMREYFRAHFYTAPGAAIVLEGVQLMEISPG